MYSSVDCAQRATHDTMKVQVQCTLYADEKYKKKTDTPLLTQPATRHVTSMSHPAQSSEFNVESKQPEVQSKH